MLNEQPPPIRIWLGPHIVIKDPTPPPRADFSRIRERAEALRVKRAQQQVEEGDNAAS